MPADVTGSKSTQHGKNKTPVLGNAVPNSDEEPKRVWLRTLEIFQDRPMFSHINGKLSPRPFELSG